MLTRRLSPVFEGRRCTSYSAKFLKRRECQGREGAGAPGQGRHPGKRQTDTDGPPVLKEQVWAHGRAQKSFDIALKDGSSEALDLVATTYPNAPARQAAKTERDKVLQNRTTKNDRQQKLRYRKLAQQL